MAHSHAHSHHAAQTYRRSVRWVLLLTLALNLLSVVLKGLVGWWTGSLSLWADALHSVTDGANNVLGLVTNQLADPTPDRDHPYGHQKYEAIGALGIAAFLGIACFEILQGAIARLLGEGEPVNLTPPALGVLLLILGINLGVAYYEHRMGKRLHSPILLADAQHTLGDVWTTVGVLIGLVGVWLGWQWLDVAMALPVALLVCRSGWVVLRENLPWLVDAMAIAPEAIHATAMAVPGVLNCHDVASRGLLGRQVFIDMHLVVEPQQVEAAHQITEQVEAAILAKYGPARITIHIEPLPYQSSQISYGP